MASSRNKPATDSLPRLVGQRLVPYLAQGRRVTVAYSGGLDSTVLLHLLTTLRREGADFSLGAVHVNHGLSPNAAGWQQHCERYCRELDIPLQCVSVLVGKGGGEGLEGAARRERHEILHGLISDWVALAHHRDDQAETLLLNLLRGTGWVGAGAMAECTGKLLRPLLTVSRARLYDYAIHHDLRWVEDESNENNAFRRNYLRNEIIPRIGSYFPAASENLARAARGFRAAAGLLEDLARQDIGDRSRLSVDTLSRLGAERAENLLYWYLRWHGARVRRRGELEEFIRQLVAATPDAAPCLRLGGFEIHRYRGEVWVVPEIAETENVLPWQGEHRLPWMGGEILIQHGPGGAVRQELLDKGRVSFRLRRGGERLQPGRTRKSRPLKDWLRESAIPPWIRGRLPLMYCNEDLVWVPGVGVAAGYLNEGEGSGIGLEFSGLTW